MKREYLFVIELSDEEYANLKQIGEILKNSDDFNLGIKIDPDDLIPESLQASLRKHLGSCLKSLYNLKLSSRKIH